MWLRGDGFRHPEEGGMSPSSKGLHLASLPGSPGGPLTHCACLSSLALLCARQQARGPSLCAFRAVSVGRALPAAPVQGADFCPASGVWQAVPSSPCPSAWAVFAFITQCAVTLLYPECPSFLTCSANVIVTFAFLRMVSLGLQKSKFFMN